MSTFRLLLLLCVAVSAAAQAPVSVRVLLGATDTEATSWDGGVRARGASIVSIEPWRFEGTDALDGNRWRASTHAARRFGAANQGAPPPVVANGIILTLSGPDPTELDFETAQGNFQVRTDEITYGRFLSKLNGRVLADRIPPTQRIAETPEEEDYPAAVADREGNVWMAYTAFRHHPRHNELRVALRTPLEDEPVVEIYQGDRQNYEQEDGQLVWASPLWITYNPKP